MAAQEHSRVLHAATVALQTQVDLDPLDLVGRDGCLLAHHGLALVGWGRAARASLPRGLGDPEGREGLAALLASVVTDDPLQRPGTGPLALGSLPFDPGAPASLVIPEVLFGRDATGCWLTVIGTDHRRLGPHELTALLAARAAEAAAGGGPAGPPGPPRAVVAHPQPQAFTQAVARAVAAIGAGQLAKVVLARCVDVELDGPLSPSQVARRLSAREPTSAVFVMPVDGGHFLGATPELVVARRGTQVRCHPLAGTTALEHPGTPGATPDDRLLGSAKELEEHALVVAAVAEGLRPFCARLFVPKRPEVARLGNDARLSTRIEGLLEAGPQGVPTDLDLLAELHPTPAVGGVPRPAALELIGALEPQDRGHWAGPVGWTDRSGDGEWFLGIRSVTLEGSSARVWAGAGIVAASDPGAELDETTLKLAPVLDALGAGSKSPGA